MSPSVTLEGDSEALARVLAELPDTVKPTLTRKRRRREVETLDYLTAAKRFIRAAGRRCGDADEIQLAALIALRGDLEEAIRDAVRGQRALGRSWAYIATATGTTREAAFQRYKDRS